MEGLNIDYKENKKKRVVVLLEYYPPYMGSDKRIYELTRQFEKLSVFYIVMAPIRYLLGLSDESLINYIKTYYENKKVKEKNVIYLTPPKWIKKIIQKNRFLGLLLFLVLSFRMVISIVKKIKPNFILLAHPSINCGLLGVIIGKLLGIKIVLDYPDSWYALYLETFKGQVEGSIIKNSLSKIIFTTERFIAKLSDKIITITFSLRALIIKLFRLYWKRKDIFVVPNGFSMGLFTSGSYNIDLNSKEHENDLTSNREIFKKIAIFFNKDNDRIAIYIGRLEDWSIPDKIIADLIDICKSTDKFRLIIVGDGTKRKKIERMIERSPCKEKILVTGVVPHESIPYILHNTQIALLPFEKNLLTEISLPVKLFEYLIAGNTVISTDLLEVKRLSKYFKNRLIISDIENFKEKLLSLISKENLDNKELDHYIRKNIEKYSWKNLSRKYEKVIISDEINRDKFRAF